MLTRETMGALALAILWVNTLLVAAAAWKEIAKLSAKRRALGEVLHGKVVRGDGEGASIAELAVEQVGRMGGSAERPSIVFFDKTFASVSRGGTIAIDGGAIEIAIERGTDVEVWLSKEEVERAGACASQRAFDDALVHARKAKGWSRTLAAKLCAGSEVWFAGALEATSGRATAKDGALISSFDPRGWIAGKIAMVGAFIAIEIALASLATALALHAPVFGPISTAGGALGLAFFLLVQPAGTAVRDAARFPSVRFARGAWSREAAPAVDLAVNTIA